MTIVIKPIGYIESPFKEKKGVPIQPCFSNAFGTVIVDPKYAEGLKDLDGFSHIMLIYYFDRSERVDLVTKPFLDEKLHGVFATRSPHRPSKIGVSIVKLVKVEGNKILVKGIDTLDQTPLIDIKPFVPYFDCYNASNYSVGWLSDKIERAEKEGKATS